MRRTGPRVVQWAVGPRAALLCMCALVSLALASPALGASEAARKIGLLPLDPVRLPGDVLMLLQSALQRRLEARTDVAAMSQGKTLTYLQAVRDFGLSCDRESTECIIRIGALAGTDRLVRGVATRGRVLETGYEVTLQLWLHDTADGHVQSYVYASLPGDARARQTALDDAWARLFTPTKAGGALHIVSELEDAVVSVDALAVPLRGGEAQLRGLLPGDHVVEVSRLGHETLRSRATIVVGEEVEVYELLAPVENDPPVPVVVPAPPLQLGGIATNMVFTGGALLVGGSVAMGYGVLENLRRNGVTAQLRDIDADYRARDYDITNANDASVPFGAALGGVIFMGLGGLMMSGGLTLFALGAE